MTSREKEILNIIKNNPMITQQQLADVLNITRSSVAVHITNLTKKGYIKGKGYVLSESEYATVIGGTNIDIQGFTHSVLKYMDSNPGKVKLSLGGVGRNIAENLTKLGVETKLISAFGDDLYGAKILNECKACGIDMDNCLALKNTVSSVYLSVLDECGDMRVAISDMDIFEEINIDFLKSKSYVIENSEVIIMDTNIRKDAIEYLLNNYKHKAFFLDTVSTTKAEKVKDMIGYFHTIKPNKYEAEILTDIKIKNNDDLRRVSDFLLNKGVERVFISLGKEGVYYSDGCNSNLIKTPEIKVINATGAGDAFIAALVYSYINDYDIEYAARYSMAASVLALSHENTINPNISNGSIINKMKELKLC
ncbi:PfkB family carbohydrate kinase [Brassicibacter mesophilus]|uniref:PfkB family carbohydrate kinase n=1 Tax=Brassicibacter mesophilus TaxID=745119 RepID=UPI003D1FD9F4